jgi:cell wall-active antibiotic response 4TMS protein YvqF
MAAARFSPERLTLGLMLVAVGVLVLLANFGRLDLLDTLRAFWPLSLVLWGSLELVAFLRTRSRDRRS